MGGGIPEGSLILIEGSVERRQERRHAAAPQRRAEQRLPLRRSTRPRTRRAASSARWRASSLDVTDFFLLGALNVYPRAGGDGRPRSATTASTRCCDHIGLLEGSFDCHLHRLADVVRLAGAGVGDAAVPHAREGVLSTSNMTIFFTHPLVRLRGGDVHPHAVAVRRAPAAARARRCGDQLMKVLEVAKVRGAEKTHRQHHQLRCRAGARHAHHPRVEREGVTHMPQRLPFESDGR